MIADLRTNLWAVGLLALLTSTGDGAAANSSRCLVWADEFSGREIDRARWTHVVDCWGGGNNEKQCYTDRLENSFVEDGFLHIVALQERFEGPALAEERRTVGAQTAALKAQPYTSARLRTKSKGDWQFGRFEARIRFPRGQGAWPAFWMMPTDEVYGPWPASGEIDIVEAVNLGASCNSCASRRENRVTGAIHFGSSDRPRQIAAAVELRSGREGEFHTYAIEWDAGSMDWYVDGKRFFSAESADWVRERRMATGSSQDAPFDRRFHLLLNLAVGGDWAENANARGIDETGFPKTMLVDWVRVYARRATPC